MAKQSAEFRALVADAMARFQGGRPAEAESAYRAALAIVPAIPRSPTTSAWRLRRRAVIGMRWAVSRRRSGPIRLRLGALQQGRRADGARRDAQAINAFSRAAALEPQHYEAHRALGFLWLSQGERGRALDHFARTYELRRGDDRTTIARKSLTTTARHKLEHDAEQFLYLSQRTRDRPRFELLARSYGEIAKQVPNEVATLSDAQIDALGEDYNTPIHLRAVPEVAGRAVNERADRAALAAQFEEQGAVAVDDLLTPPALHALRRFLLESTIWHDFSHIDGFVASYLEDGLACPLLLQIADELRRAFPEILGKYPLSQAWAFKGLRAQSAVDVHADAATVSVNFWVTPTEANLAPERGGLVVCRAPPPDDWEIKDYDADRARIVTFLEQKAVESLVVPYCENRAVLFRSRLFHHSDRPEFASSYENHRINLTLLYG